MEIWAIAVNKILDDLTRVNGKTPADRTVKATKEAVYNFFRILYKFGYKVQDPKNIGDRHIRFVIRHKFLEKRSAKTLQNYLSRLRVFFSAIGKNTLVLKAGDYLPEVDPAEFIVSTAAKKSKGLTANGIDVAEVIRRADMENERLGLMVRMILGFGLRREEVLHCRPWYADRGTDLRVYPGEGKNGRPRDIPITTDFQRDILKYVQSKVPKSKHLGWEFTISGKKATLEQNINRLKNYARKIGLTKTDLGATLHSIRAHWVESEAIRLAFVPTTLGGVSTSMPKDELDLRQGVLAESLGHGRKGVASAYYGKLIREYSVEDRTAFRNIILGGVAALGSVPLVFSIPQDRRADVIGLEHMLLTEDDIDIHPWHIHQLWQLHSSRFGIEWVAVETGVRQALEVAARQSVINLGTVT